MLTSAILQDAIVMSEISEIRGKAVQIVPRGTIKKRT
jgi:hypothetical protein